MTNFGTISARMAGACLDSVTTRLPAEDDEAFLTIDDGPSPSSHLAADYLARRDVNATWFLSGAHADQHPETVAAIAAAGHSFGNHGFDHLDAWRNPWTRIRDDLSAGLEAVRRVSGQRCRWTRPPYGRLRMQTLSWCRSNGQKLVLWDVMAFDYRSGIDPDRVAGTIRTKVRSGSVIVMHDHGLKVQREALKLTIDGLLADGWRLRGLPATGSRLAEPAP